MYPKYHTVLPLLSEIVTIEPYNSLYAFLEVLYRVVFVRRVGVVASESEAEQKGFGA